MYFHKYPHPANFEFPTTVTAGEAFETVGGRFAVEVTEFEGGIHRVVVSGPGWEGNDALTPLELPPQRDRAEGEVGGVTVRDGTFEFRDAAGEMLLASAPGRFFGQCGETSAFEFARTGGEAFYGMGEKWTGFEHSGQTTKFWNTDVWGDFHPESFIHGKPASDPVYVSIPYLIVKRGNAFLGLLLDNPHATFVSTKAHASISGQMALDGTGPETIFLGAEQGQPRLYLIEGPSLRELTQKVQRMVGVTPRPPAWALGYHQCRWGYQSEADLDGLDAEFRKHDIPVDGLWLDIDYMDAFKVFTFAAENFPAPAEAIARFRAAGRRVVPIIDPGVKALPGYEIFDRGREAGVFCQTRQGRDYIGLVWPGETVFPDFSTESGRAWWAEQVRAFAELGIEGAWLDMNDPSTGPVELDDMRFDRGTKSHSTFHNQYALGMARATREGFLQAHPEKRPFLVSRSGCTGSGQYSAIWTGDNYSNYFHLKNSIATTLNLALSGVPFNAPDVGGFGGNTTAELLMDWNKAGFLFPFFRNHSILKSRAQEPWALGKAALAVVRRYIRLRYRLRPYLYQLFVAQERSGEAVLRPLFYDFADTAELPLGWIDDQFLVGPALMQAPFVEEGATRRRVVLPGKARWYDAMAGEWLRGGRAITVAAKKKKTPLYVRDGSLIPVAPTAAETFDARRVDWYCFLTPGGEARTSYVIDDGESFEYREGKSSEVTVTARRTRNRLDITTEVVSDGFGAGEFRFVTERSIRGVTVDGRQAAPSPERGEPLFGKNEVVWVVSPE